MLSMMGVEVGDQNHSEKYPAVVRDCAHRLIMKGLRDHMTSERNGYLFTFGWTGDKDTSKLRYAVLSMVLIPIS